MHRTIVLIFATITFQSCDNTVAEKVNHYDNGIDLQYTHLREALNEYKQVTKGDGEFEFSNAQKKITVISNALKFQEQLHTSWDFKADWFPLDGGSSAPAVNQYLFRYAETDTPKFYGIIQDWEYDKQGSNYFRIIDPEGKPYLVAVGEIESPALKFYKNAGDPAWDLFEPVPLK